MANAPFRVIIVGGGIAGLATAIAMRGPGREIVVLEKSQMLREVGALISLQPNASNIVAKWGIDRFLSKSDPIVDREFRILDSAGNLSHQITLDASKWGGQRIVYHRQDLHSSLRAAATSETLPGSPAIIHTGKEVKSIDVEQGIVYLKNGEEYMSDLIIGADGIRSAVRSFVVGEAVNSQPTGLSAYRLLIPLEALKSVSLPTAVDLRDPLTTMVMGHDRRVIMGPGRGGKLFGMVALVPDEKLNELSPSDSWTEQGSLSKLIETFADFPTWIQDVFKCADDISLWQLRDIEPLKKWVNGRAIIIGDASHAMLPTQGQGASQSIEDAEALQAFFNDITGRPSQKDIQERLAMVCQARMERATLIQQYSRQQAKPATDGQSKTITLNPEEFMEYNCRYAGAREWLGRRQEVA